MSNEHLITTGDEDSFFSNFDWMDDFPGDDINKYSREFLLSFIEDVFNMLLNDFEYEILGAVGFDQILDYAYMYGLNVADEYFKFALEEALNYLVISKILFYEEAYELNDLFGGPYDESQLRAYGIDLSGPIQ